MAIRLDKTYWSEKYMTNSTGWDAGTITTPIKVYVDQLERKGLKILIPGCGNGHEAAYLHDNGFTNVTVVDITEEPLMALKKRCPDWPATSFIVADFFDIIGEFELIIEQTFFCAINPGLRNKYAEKMNELLVPGGKLVGLLFNIPIPGTNPPYGGNMVEYTDYFKPFFLFNTFEPAYNSIEPRKGTELFINLQKPESET